MKPELGPSATVSAPCLVLMEISQPTPVSLCGSSFTPLTSVTEPWGLSEATYLGEQVWPHPGACLQV